MKNRSAFLSSLHLAVFVSCALAPALLLADENAASAKVASTAKLADEPTSSRPDGVSSESHPLVKVVDLATKELAWARKNIEEYSCLLIKRERIDGELQARQYMQVKFRDRKIADGKLVTPLSIYVKFLKPSGLAGREVLYVENQRGGDLLARRGGPRLPNLTVELKPDGRMAMQDNLNPITELGFRQLTLRLIENMQEDLAYDDAEVVFYDDAKLGSRKCQHIQVTHAKQADHFDYHLARIFIDNELRVPVYFASYDWPEEEGEKPRLNQEYIFTNINLEPGFTDKDFESNNPEYAFQEIESNPRQYLSSN